MKHRNLVVLAIAAAVGILSAAVFAQVAHPYHNGSVWDIAMIRIKPGMDEAYLKYLTGEWKAAHEAMKKDGLILSYKVLMTEAHGSNDWNMLLMTEFKDMATMEANEDKMDAVEEKVTGDQKKQEEGYKNRESIREVLGDRMAREIVLEPKK